MSFSEAHSIFIWVTNIGTILQHNSTQADRDAHIDIADWLIRYLCHPEPVEGSRRNAEFLKAVEFISEDRQEEVGKLIQEMGLVFMGVEKVEADCHSERSEESLS